MGPRSALARPGRRQHPMTATASRQPSVAAGAVRRRMVNAWPVWLLTLATFAIYTLFALERHRQFNTAGYDLGIFDQRLPQFFSHWFKRSLVGRIFGDHGFNAFKDGLVNVTQEGQGCGTAGGAQRNPRGRVRRAVS